MIDMRTGRVIRLFENARKVGTALKIKHRQISSCCKKERESANGYKWRFYEGTKSIHKCKYSIVYTE